MKCPKCKSESIVSSTKGFSLAKAATGGILLGPLGLLAGTHKMNDVRFTCLNCGHRFGVGDVMAYRRAATAKAAERMRTSKMTDEEFREYQRAKREKERRRTRIFCWVISVFVLSVVAVIVAKYCF